MLLSCEDKVHGDDKQREYRRVGMEKGKVSSLSCIAVVA